MEVYTVIMTGLMCVATLCSAIVAICFLRISMNISDETIRSISNKCKYNIEELVTIAIRGVPINPDPGTWTEDKRRKRAVTFTEDIIKIINYNFCKLPTKDEKQCAEVMHDILKDMEI